MKKLDLGQAIATLANIGVIAGILFLGIELRQNNQLLRAEAIGALLETRMYTTEEVVSNDSLLALLAKNRRNLELTLEERMRLGAYFSRDLMGYQRDYFLFQEGILSEEYMRTNLPRIKSIFNSDTDLTISRREHWESFRDIAPAGYREFIDQCVISECEILPR